MAERALKRTQQSLPQPAEMFQASGQDPTADQVKDKKQTEEGGQQRAHVGKTIHTAASSANEKKTRRRTPELAASFDESLLHVMYSCRDRP